MSLQQALRQIPSVNRLEELRRVLNENRWSTQRHYLSPLISVNWQEEEEEIRDARQAFFTAQDELNRILGKA